MQTIKGILSLKIIYLVMEEFYEIFLRDQLHSQVKSKNIND